MEIERPADLEPMTGREKEILRLIADGLSNQQIADRLFLALGTVKWYNKQIFQKLGVRSRTQAVLRAREPAPPGEAASGAGPGLPEQNTDFIGREAVLRDIRARLENPACRLLTLTGPGGIGKTRLALETARRQASAFPDGVIFVPCVQLDSPESLAQALADRLGLTAIRRRDPLEQVIYFLREKTLLLVIDNFEHLLAGAAWLAKVLDGTSHAKMLVTSRERLHLRGEWVLDVLGLTFPAPGGDAPGQLDLAEYEACSLFLQTARRVKSNFAPDAADTAHIARICRYLEGMPLGIELAASWVRLLSCAEIVRELAHGPEILTTSWRDLPERHRSFRSVLDHSWKLLAPPERDAFRRLTVFSGSFGREAAQAVAGTSLLLLLALVDKSFLQRAGADRFGFHELVKQYGGGLLRADPQVWAETRLRHCRYYAAFLEERMRGPGASLHLGEVERVFEDIQAAWRDAVENRRVDEIERLAAGLLVYYRLHGWYRAGASAPALYRQALDCFPPQSGHPGRRSTTACLHESLGDLHELATDHEKAIAAYEQSVENTPQHDTLRRGRLFGKMADSRVAMNQHDQGERLYLMAEAVLESAPERDAGWWVEWLRVLLQRMELFYWQNRPEDMAGLARRIGPMIDPQHALPQRLRFLSMQSLMALRRDRYFYSGDAIAFSGQAFALSLETGNLNDIASTQFSHGFSHLWSDHLDEAEEHLHSTRRLAGQSGDLALLTRALAYLTVVYRRRGSLELVREYAAQTLALAAEARMPQYAGMSHAHSAWLAWRAGDLAQTKAQAQAAIDDWGGLGTAQSMVPFRWFALFPLMGAAIQEEELDQAIQWARHLLLPIQQRLPDDLTGLLEEAVATWEQGQPEAANLLARQAFGRAQASGYV